MRKTVILELASADRRDQSENRLLPSCVHSAGQTLQCPCLHACVNYMKTELHVIQWKGFHCCWQCTVHREGKRANMCVCVCVCVFVCFKICVKAIYELYTTSTNRCKWLWVKQSSCQERQHCFVFCNLSPCWYSFTGEWFMSNAFCKPYKVMKGILFWKKKY